jgi:hypothetical protein
MQITFFSTRGILLTILDFFIKNHIITKNIYNNQDMILVKQMKNKKILPVFVLFISFILIFSLFSGCVKEIVEEIRENKDIETKKDIASVLPSWEDGEYHDYYKTTDLLSDFHIDYPDLVNVFSIGKSVLGKDIWCIRITNENNSQNKYTCFIDGCMHGSEWESCDACLYFAEYLLINFENNITINSILNQTEIYIVPLFNPDGRQNDNRFNENGIDLNRNFDVHFGALRGHSIPLGKLFGRIKIPKLVFPRLNLWFTNSGRRAFSEPESSAIRDFMKELDSKNKFSFYLNCHTATHNIITPWSTYKPVFELSTQQNSVFNYAKNWISENTEYEDSDLWYAASGTSMDWCFKEFEIPSFTFEILSMDYEPGDTGGKHDNLVHWMKTTLPVYIYLVVNIENLYNWQIPENEPLLPEGVPPDPI